MRAFEKKHHLERDGEIGAGQLAKMKKLARTRGGIHVTNEMRRLAKAGRAVAMSMGGYSGLGLCATGVSPAIRSALGISVWGKGNQIDDNLPRSRSGHTAITVGNGFSSTSDFYERNTLAAGGRSGLKIFAPIR